MISKKKKYKTVVDTNSINNSGLGNKLFGSRDELEKLRDYVDLYVPEIVISEIKAHKYNHYLECKRSLLKNELIKLAGIDKESIEKVDIRITIENDIISEDYPYTIIQIDDYEGFFNKYIPLAIRRKPPFQKESDKGIQDAFVAASVEKLLNEIGDEEKILLATKDARLREYFEDNNRVRCVGSLDDIPNELDHDDGEITKDDTKVEISFSGLRDKEPRRAIIEKILTDYRNSLNFRQTHEYIAVLKRNQKFLEKEDKKDIIESSLNNRQIRWVITDADVYEFLVPIYYDCIDILDEAEKIDFETAAGIRNRDKNSNDDVGFLEIPF